ncbi:MAG: hypothetical protein AB7D03_03840 [Thiomicrospira sp.]
MNDKPLESVTASVLVHEGGSYRVDKGKPVKVKPVEPVVNQADKEGKK